MHSPLQSFLRPAWRRWVICCLLVSVPVYGLAGSLIQLLGSSHYHRAAQVAAADPMAGWKDFRREGGGSIGSGYHVHVQPHTHSIFQRHHHDADDDTVVSIDGGDGHDGASGDGPATTGSASLTLALPDGLRLPLPSARVIRWSAIAASAVASRDPERLERPPRA